MKRKNQEIEEEEAEGMAHSKALKPHLPSNFWQQMQDLVQASLRQDYEASGP